MASRKGFTLLEVLIYSAIFAMISVGLITTFVTVTKVQTEQASDAEVDQQSLFLLQKLQGYVAGASLIDLPVNTPTSTLRLRMSDPALDPTTITLATGTVFVRQGPSGQNTALTSGRVAVSALTFSRQSNPSSHDSVSLSFKVSPAGSLLTNAITRAFELSVTRVSAANFDSDLVPSSTNLNLGVTGNPWSSVNNVLYFNGTKVGVNNNAPAQPLDVTGNAVIRGNLGIQNPAPTAFLDLRSFIAGTHPANTTLAVFRDFYNNGSNGQQLWLNAEGAGGVLTDINLTNDWGKLTFGAGGGGQTVRDDLEISGGNLGLGIGTSSPRAKFEINGNLINSNAYNGNVNLGSYDVGVGSVGATTVYGYNAVCTGNASGNCASSGGVVLGLNNAASTVNIPNGGNTFFNGGNVGIGTSTPAALLMVSGAASTSTQQQVDIYNPGNATGQTAGIRFHTGSGWNVQLRTNQNTDWLELADSSGNAVQSWNGSTYTVGAGGSGKITVATIDPLYTINGDKYATYEAAMTGVKEETAGVVNLVCKGSDCSATLDFNGPKGSDLWLFGQVTNLRTNFDKMVVLLTPSFDGRTWYTKDKADMKLVVHGTAAGEVSYRLTAPRFDAGKFTNQSTDPSAGLIINN